MKTINSKKKQDCIYIFLDKDGKEQCGFSGNVTLYDESIFVDTRDGTGYDKVIKKLDVLIGKLAAKFKFSGNSNSDTKQDVIIHILEGIPKYNPMRDSKLSTFIEMYVDRRLINDIRNNSRYLRNATFLNIETFRIICSCGNDFIVTTEKGQENTKTCVECGLGLDKAKKKFRINIPETLEQIQYFGDDEMSENNITKYYDRSVLTDSDKTIEDDVIFKHDLEKFLKTADPKTVKLVELIYFEDYSLEAAAQKIGMTKVWANVKLQGLREKKNIKELFGRVKNEHKKSNI